MSREKARSDFDFGPYEDEYIGFESRGDDKARGPLIMVLAVGVLVIFAAVVWNTYRQGIRPAEGSLPVIARPEDPYKRAPDDAGGVDVAGTDRGFYGLMDGSAPDMPDLRAALAADPLEGAPPPLPESASGAPVMRTRTTSQATPSGAAETGPAGAGAGDQDVRLANLTPRGAAPVREPRPVAPAASVVPEPSRFSRAGRYQVQLMAVRSETAAEAAWADIRTKHPVLYRDARLDVQRADLGARGVFYRLRVGNFTDRGAASGFCEDIKATGRDCIVVSRPAG